MMACGSVFFFIHYVKNFHNHAVAIMQCPYASTQITTVLFHKWWLDTNTPDTEENVNLRLSHTTVHM